MRDHVILEPHMGAVYTYMGQSKAAKMSGYIDNYARPDNPVIDITGTPLKVQLNFVDKGAATPTNHPVLMVPGLPGIPPSLVNLLSTPLNQMFDQVWAQKAGPDGKTPRDRTGARVISQISNSIRALGSAYSAYSIRVTLPTTGSLLALVLSGSLTNPNASQVVLLSYQLTGFVALFSVTTPYTGGRIRPLPDPDYKLTFDVEFLVSIVVPLGVGPLTTVASFNVENASISADNFSAQLGNAVITAVNFLSGQPTNIFEGAEGQINTAANASDDLDQLDSLLSQLAKFWSVASGTFGFNQLTALIDSEPALNFRFAHALDPAPIVKNAADSAFPSLFHPQLGTSAPVVQAGNSLGVTGSNFPAAQASQLLITWMDTTSGIVSQSDIMWGPANGPTRVDSKSRGLDDDQNFFVASGLAPGSPFAFSVRDQDFLTETPFSDPLTLTTQSTDVVALTLAPQAGGPQRAVGSAVLTLGGVFSSFGVIPSDLADGIYIISAALAGGILATTGIRVVAAGKTVPPTLEAIDPTTNLVVQSIIEGEALTLRGAGFRPGEIDITIDTAGGQALGTATGDPAGSFQVAFKWPVGIIGMRKVVAEQTAGGPTLDASTNLFVQQIPE